MITDTKVSVTNRGFTDRCGAGLAAIFLTLLRNATRGRGTGRFFNTANQPVRGGSRCDQLRPKLAGFTLVELLIVIAIIAMLAALLLPSLKLAQESGRRAFCASNQHQLGLAMNMYASDFNDAVSYSYPSVDQNPTGSGVITRFGFAVYNWGCVPAANHGLWTYCNYAPGSLLICPSQTLAYDSNAGGWAANNAWLKKWKGGSAPTGAGGLLSTYAFNGG